MPTFELPDHLSLSSFVSLATGTSALSCAPTLPDHVNKAHDFLSQRLAAGDEVYGVNTGFGPLVDRTVAEDDIRELQRNLLQQLSGNVGPLLPTAISRGTTVLRANALSKGHSGARFAILKQLTALVNSGATAPIRAYGSVGASGDLVPLTRLARVLLGDDHLRLPDGTVVENSDALLKKHGMVSLELEPKEGLALVNGTSYSTAITALCLDVALRMLEQYTIPLTATLLLALGDSLQHLSPEIYRLKKHESALSVCRSFTEWLSPHQPHESHGTPQPPYSGRSVVLWLGAVAEHFEQARRTIEIEMNSVDDNPLIFPDDQRILHAANFQGTYAAKAADDLSQGLVKMANLVERHINRLFHDKLNGDLPAFLAPEPIGLHSGLQGFQLLATSLLADIRAKSVAHGTQSFPTNADNQDVVSMSANAALNALEITRKTAYLTAIFESSMTRLLQIRDLSLTEELQNWWDQRNELFAHNFPAENLAPILEKRKAVVMPWDE